MVSRCEGLQGHKEAAILVPRARGEFQALWRDWQRAPWDRRDHSWDLLGSKGPDVERSDRIIRARTRMGWPAVAPGAEGGTGAGVRQHALDEGMSAMGLCGDDFPRANPDTPPPN